MISEDIDRTTQEVPSAGAQLRRTLRVLRERWWILLVFVALLAAGAYLRASREPKVYQATATLLYAPSNASQALTGNPDFPGLNSASTTADPTTFQTIVDLVDSRAVRRHAAALVGPIPASQSVQASIEQGSNLILLTADAGTGRRAAAVANAWARAVSEVRAGSKRAGVFSAIALVRQKLRQGSNAGSDQVPARVLRRQLQQLQVLAALQQSDVQVAQAATAPSTPASPTPVKDAAIGGLAGLLLAIFILALVEVLDRRMKTVPDAERAWGAPLLGSLPPGAPQHVDMELKHNPTREALQYLQANLTFIGATRTARVIAVTSPLKAEGKTTTALGLAVTLAASGRSTALLDCDFRRRTITEKLEIGSGGISNVLAGTTDIPNVIMEVPVSLGPDAATNGARRTLDVVGAGPTPPNVLELLSGERFRRLIEELRHTHDYVVVDCAPLLPISDTLPIVAAVDGVLITELLYTSRFDSARRARMLIESAGGRILGLVIGATKKRAYDAGYGYGYGYGSNYGYGSSAKAGREQERQLPAQTADPALPTH